MKLFSKKKFTFIGDRETLRSDEEIIFPWFQELSSEEAYGKRLIKDKSKKFVGYPAEKWLAALQIENKEQLI